jgi:oligopeptide transport system substrate-binding protein
MNHRILSSRNLLTTLLALVVVVTSCTTTAKEQTFFGKVEVPKENVLKYISGSEPESLDPQIGSGQPEARIYLALYEGLTEYDPKTTEAIPALAERWDVNQDISEFVFHLRKDGRWSNGDPITAHDFVYSLRRGTSPELAARYAYLTYYIKYAQPYNEGKVFVRDPATGRFLLEQDLKPELAKPQAADHMAGDSPFHQYIHSPTRLTVAADEESRREEFEKNPGLEALLKGKEFVPIKGEDIGVEAIDNYTLRITLTQSAPFFIKMTPHPFFRAIHRGAIEKHKEAWTQPSNIVTSGPYKLSVWKPYNELVLVKNAYYWDAAKVKLDRLVFYPIEDATTAMNLYKAGQVDAVHNHTVPVAWLEKIRGLKDYMDAPEIAVSYFQINTTKAPMNDVRVRKAFNMSIDKVALSKSRRITKPLTAFSPEGIFPNYPQPKGDVFNPERARQLLAEAGYRDGAGKYDPSKFPVDQVEITYNTAESNKAVSEYLQAQWKQNLGLTVRLKNMEWRTFLDHRAKLEYKGFARSGWIGDFMDPFTFLGLFYTKGGDNGTGWYDTKYVKMLDQANVTLDPQKRYELLAKAEAYLLDAQPLIPLSTDATNWMKKPYVKGMYPNPQTLHAWKYVYIESDPAKWDYGVPNLRG